MSRRLIGWIIILFLPLTVPWWFTGGGGTILGMPIWAFYSAVMTLLYAVLVTLFMAFQWKKLAQDEGDDAE